MPEILPSSNMRVPTGTVFVRGVEHERLFCADCGVQSSYWTPKSALDDAPGTFNCWICEPCAEKRPLDLTKYVMPDEEFGRRAAAEMIEREGRVLSVLEQTIALDNPEHWLSKLAKDRPHGR